MAFGFVVGISWSLRWWWVACVELSCHLTLFVRSIYFTMFMKASLEYTGAFGGFRCTTPFLWRYNEGSGKWCLVHICRTVVIHIRSHFRGLLFYLGARKKDFGTMWEWDVYNRITGERNERKILTLY